MNEWMNTWINKWMNKQINEWINKYKISKSIFKYKFGVMFSHHFLVKFINMIFISTNLQYSRALINKNENKRNEVRSTYMKMLSGHTLLIFNWQRFLILA